MSARMTFWAWEQPVKSSEKLILLSMANCHNDTTGECYPSIDYVVKTTGLNRKTVIRGIGNLTEAGYISTKKSFGAVNRYSFNSEVIAPKTSTNIGTGQNTKTSTKTSTKNGTSTENGTSTKNGTRPVPKTVLAPVPILGHESKRESKKNLKEVITVPVEINSSAWFEFFEWRKTEKKKPITPLSAKKIFKQLAEYSHEDQAAIFDQSIRNGWQGIFPEKLNRGEHGTHQRPVTKRERIAEATYGPGALDF